MRIFLLVSILAISTIDAGWQVPKDGTLNPEAQHMKGASRVSYSGFAQRPGFSTKTHSCSYIRGLPKELRHPGVMRPRGLTQFYQKYTEAYGIPVVGSSNVPDDALKRACYTLRFLLADSALMRHEYYKMGGRVAIIGKDENTTDIPEHSWLEDWWNERARGLGASTHYPISTGAEENALCMWRDGWFGDDIVLHEYLHGLHALGANQAIPGFEKRMENLYASMKKDGRWNNTYAMSTEWEYFAETGQSYLNSHISVPPPFNGIHNHIFTRAQLKQFDRTMFDIHQNVIFTCGNEYIPPCKGSASGLTSAERRAKEHAQVLRMDCDGTVAPGGNNPDCKDSGRYGYCQQMRVGHLCGTDTYRQLAMEDCRKSCDMC